MKIINGFAIAEEVLNLASRKLHLLIRKNIVPYVAILLVNLSNQSLLYIKSKIFIAKKLGIKVKLITVSNFISKNNLSRILNLLNLNKKITGILIQLPLSLPYNKNIFFAKINYKKDIDALSIYNMGLLAHNITSIIPCTPQGILYLLKKYFNSKILGKKILILSRSIIIGKPLLLVLLNLSCTITVLHSFSYNIKYECIISDIIISATGKLNFINEKWVRKNTFMIDVGLNYINSCIIGDINFHYNGNYITPVPGGIGPVTVASLMINIVKTCYMNFNIKYIS